MGALFQYYQVRYMYEVGQIWDPMLPANVAARWRQERLAQVAVPA